MRKIVWATTLIATTYANAATVGLTCVSLEDKKYTVGVDFDENYQSVSVNGVVASNVKIDQTSIDFVLTLNTTRYFQTLNRSNGFMLVQNKETQRIVDTFTCSLRNNKF